MNAIERVMTKAGFVKDNAEGHEGWLHKKANDAGIWLLINTWEGDGMPGRLPTENTQRLAITYQNDPFTICMEAPDLYSALIVAKSLLSAALIDCAGRSARRFEQ